MRLKKIWLLVLVFAICFSVVHDYTFNILDTKHPANSSYVADACLHNADRHTDTMCEIHHDYHSIYLFLMSPVSFLSRQKVKSIFVYTNNLFSLHIFTFLKPPIL